MALTPDQQAASDALKVVNDFLMANQNWQVIPQANGQLQWGFPAAPPPPPAPTIATIPNVQSFTTSTTINYATYVSGTYSTLSIANLPSGWTFSGTALTGTAPTAAGSVQLSATGTAGSAVSNTFTLPAVSAPLSPDVSAPSVPMLLTGSLVNNQPALEWLSCSDPSPAGFVWSGMKDYLVYRSINGAAVSLLNLNWSGGTVNAPTAGVQFSMSAADIGSPAVAGSTTQSGSTLSIAGGGTDFSGSADQGQFCGAQINGNWICSFNITALTGPEQYSSTGVNARLTLAANSPCVTAKFTPPTTGGGQLLDSRTAVGGATVDASANTVDYTLPIYGVLQNSSGVFTMSYGATQGSVTAFAPLTNAMGTSMYLGAYATAHQATGSTDATIANFNVTQDGMISFTDTSIGQTSSSQSVVYTVAARDKAGNISAQSASVTLTIPATGSSSFGIQNVKGVLTNLQGVKTPLLTVCIPDFQTMNGGGSRITGWLNVTQAQFATALTKWGTADGLIAAAQPTCLRFQMISSYPLGVTGTVSPLTDDGPYYTTGSPQAPLMSASEYMSIFTQVVTRATAAGWFVCICLATDSIIEPNGTRHLGLGQPIAPGPDAVAFWTLMANTFKNNPAVIFELFNEAIITSLVNSNGTYGTYGAGDPYTADTYSGPTVPGPDMYTYLNAQSASTVLTPPAGSNGAAAGCTMMNNSASSSSLQFICNSMKLAGINEMINAITATGAPNLIIVGLPAFAGGIDCYQALNITDPRGNNQVCAAYHCYGQGHYAAIQALQSAGIATIMTEAAGGNFTSGTGFKYSQMFAAGLGCSLGSNGWNNYGASSNPATASAGMLTIYPNNQGMAVPNGSN